MSSGQRSRNNMSASQSRSHAQSLHRQDSTTQPWRVTRSTQSYGSLGSYATTDSNLSDEFSFDESVDDRNHQTTDRGAGQQQQRAFEPVEEEDEEEGHYGTATVLRPAIADRFVSASSSNRDTRFSRATNTTSQVLLDAPYSPDWTRAVGNTPTQPPIVKSISASTGDARRRPMSVISDGPNDSHESSGEVAFV